MNQSLKQNAQPKRVPLRLNVASLKATLNRIPRRTWLLWLVASALGLFLLPLSLVASSLTDEVNALHTDLGEAVAAQTSVPTLQPQVLVLLRQLDQTQSQSKQIQAVLPTLTAGKLDLPGVMSVVGNYDPNQIALDGTLWSGTELTLDGHAVNDQAVINYVNALEASGKFKQVVLQSVQIQDAQVVTMTVAPGSILPTATLTATATTTPTPSLLDIYEPDDTQLPTYYLGQSQTHSFYPNGDVDRVSFLVKAGRYYQVSTMNLASGVDTSLSISVGGQIFSNDDFKTGSLYSEVIFAAPAQDALATITITNRGQFGTGQTYDLTIVEIGPTETPTTTATVAATGAATGAATTAPATATWTPTSTQTLVPTATATLFVPSVTPTLFVPTPTATNTLVPPTATATLPPPTVVPSPTDLPTVPPTATPTLTPIPAFSIVNANLGVSPQTGTTCPGTFNFNGTLSAIGSGTATFVFERSDGTTSGAQSVEFAGDGTINVSDMWSIAGAPGFNFNGWERLRVLSPNPFVSNQADILLVCAPDMMATPSASLYDSLSGQALKVFARSNTFAMMGSALSGWLTMPAVQPAPRFSARLAGTPPAQRPADAPHSAAMPIHFVILIELQAGVP